MPIIEEVKGVKKAVKKQIITYMSAGLGFVAGLAWNDAFKALIEFLFPRDSESMIIQFIYAIFVTLLTATLIYFLQKLVKEDN